MSFLELQLHAPPLRIHVSGDAFTPIMKKTLGLGGSEWEWSLPPAPRIGD